MMKRTDKRNKRSRLLVPVCCLVAMGFTVAAAALSIPWLCLGTMVSMGVAVVLDD